MAAKRTLECDFCGVKVEEDSAARWIALRMIGRVVAWQDPQELTFDRWECVRDWATVGAEGGRVLTPAERARVVESDDGSVEIRPPVAIASVHDDDGDRRAT